MTTLECENQSQLNMNGGVLNTDLDTRMTQNVARETLAFDNRPFEFEQFENIRQQEQEIRLKSSFLNR